MRLAILDRGHGLGTKVLFAIIRTISRQPIPEVVKLVMYRPDFFGTHMKAVTHEAMRGPSAWSVGDRELMAAFVSKANQCEFCIKAHTAVSARAYRDDAKVAAALSDLERADIGAALRAVLRMLGKLTREHKVDVDDMRGGWPPAFRASRSRMRSQSASHLTRSTGWPMPSSSSCRGPKRSRWEPSSSSRAAIVEGEGTRTSNFVRD